MDSPNSRVKHLNLPLACLLQSLWDNWSNQVSGEQSLLGLLPACQSKSHNPNGIIHHFTNTLHWPACVQTLTLFLFPRIPFDLINCNWPSISALGSFFREALFNCAKGIRPISIPCTLLVPHKLSVGTHLTLHSGISLGLLGSLGSAPYWSHCYRLWSFSDAVVRGMIPDQFQRSLRDLAHLKLSLLTPMV